LGDLIFDKPGTTSGSFLYDSAPFFPLIQSGTEKQ